MGRKALPIHETAPRDIEFLTLMNRRVTNIDSKYITDADRERLSKALAAVVEILEKTYRSYWSL
jgi:hypothetical protein